MGEQTGIEWADSTFNPWVGCTKISPACDNCYAEEWANRFKLVEWGNRPRKRTSATTWREPLKWNRDADEFENENGRPRFVFCASLADVFDNQVDTHWRTELWELIKKCDRLVWLLLTKRPQNISNMLPADWGDGYPNVWLGTTIENQTVVDKNIPQLLNVPAVKHFLSIEPMLGPIDLGGYLYPAHGTLNDDPLAAALMGAAIDEGLGWVAPGVAWVIAGGESGANARPAHPDWYRSLRDQCEIAGVPFHFKQWGEWLPWDQYEWAPVPLETDPTTSSYRTMVQRSDGTWWDAGHADWSLANEHEDGGAHFNSWVGKKNAGRALDGQHWDGRPTPTRMEKENVRNS